MTTRPYTLILGNAWTDEESINFVSIREIRTYATYEEAEEAGEAALFEPHGDTYVIPQAYIGTINYPSI